MADAGAIDDRLELAAQLPEVARAVAWCEALGEQAGCPPRVLFGIAVSLEEALTNIVSYGFPHGPPPEGARIWLQCRWTPQRAELRIEDNGVPFDPSGLPDPAPAPSVEEARVGGHGMQLVRHFMGEVQYAFEGGRNVLVLAARLS